MHRIPDEQLFTDGIEGFYLYTCRANDRHKVVVPTPSLAAVPKGLCPICSGELLFQSRIWEGAIPADGYDPDAARDAVIDQGYFTWKVGEGTD